MLAADGAYVLIGHDAYGRVGRRRLGSLPTFAALAARSAWTRQLRRAGRPRPGKREAMAELREHAAAGRLTAVADRAFDLADTAQALRHLVEGAPVGRVVVTA